MWPFGVTIHQFALATTSSILATTVLVVRYRYLMRSTDAMFREQRGLEYSSYDSQRKSVRKVTFSEVSQLPRVDYCRQPMQLLPIDVRMFKVLLKCGFYDRGSL